MKAQKPNKPRTFLKRPIVWAGGGLLAAALVITLLEVTNVTHFFHTQKITVRESASQDTKGEPKTTGSSAQKTAGSSGNSSSPETGAANAGSSTPGAAKSSPQTGAPAATLLIPTGDFVSNHHPNMSGSPAPNEITSVCTTTPGASCTIAFINTSSGAAKALPAETTDAGGSAYWDWKLQSVGLTPGTWQIKATATLGNQTQTATDAMNLVVGP